MLLIPAIDLKDGHCVRLQQGDMTLSTTFSEEPSVMARSWVDKGARRVHLVDLNGAFAGQPKNEAAIRKILKTIGSEVDVQLGGGIRDLDTIERYLDAGLRYVIIGTAAVRNPGFLQDACTAFGGHIIVGLDAKDGNEIWKYQAGKEISSSPEINGNKIYFGCYDGKVYCLNLNQDQNLEIKNEKPRLKKPPVISMTASFDVGTDKLLAPSEKGFITLKISNKGRGDAGQLSIQIREISNKSGIDYSIPHLFDLSAGAEKIVNIKMRQRYVGR